MPIALSQRFRYPTEFAHRLQRECGNDVQLMNLLRIGSVISLERNLREHYPELHKEFQSMWQNRTIEAGFCIVD